MKDENPTLAVAARELTDAVSRETELARRGALNDLADAVSAKRVAYDTFKQARETAISAGTVNAGDREAIESLIAATNENAIVLDAVKTTLDNAVARFQSIFGSLTDPGVYSPLGAISRHLPAARFDASA